MPKKETDGKAKNAFAGKNEKTEQKETGKHKEETAVPAPQKRPGDPDAVSTQVVTLLFWACALFTAVFFIANFWGENAPLIRAVSSVFYGLFGWGALTLICFFAMMGVSWRRAVVKRCRLWMLTFGLLFVLLVSVLVHIIMIITGGVEAPATFGEAFLAHRYWAIDGNVVGGGFFGGFFGGLFYFLMHGVVSLLLVSFLLIADVMLFFSLTPARLYVMIAEGWQTHKEKQKERAAARKIAQEKKARQQAEEEAEEERRKAASAAQKEAAEADKKKKEATPPKKAQEKGVPEDSIDFDFDEEDEDGESEADTALPVKGTHGLFVAGVADKPDGDADLKQDQDQDSDPDYAFADHLPDGEEDASLYDTEFGYGNEDENDFDALLAGTDGADPALSNEADDDDGNDGDDADDAEEADEAEEGTGAGILPPPEEEKPVYLFPPLSLLSLSEPGSVTGESMEELERKGHRLEDVLRSFKVDTKMVHIACGPTITRYELVPKSGVRVRAIANLVDDIALNLETQGVRIEAPIPGKAAVGIEVPNKSQATVYLRSLLDTDAFRSAKSKLNVALGVDVSGAPVYMDIAKMPHLLIAGATGMGKSVCANTIIMSLLYKATPDEVKLILIDPKKVEFNVYNKLPHLLIPVVTNPKKAAGALATAVNEMERRFELIEAAGVRDIKGYNKLAQTDPERQPLPQIVIIIDELADMMMVAKDDVESAICRLAQLARAAGIHLIICTQRPSVDVITGLIKANVPSRIALTVASMVDSRTIIDVAGAEKLIGRGDMLYAPVGCMKPIRAQGAFVSEAEVEAVTDFIRDHVGDVHYDDSFLNMVEVEAEKCGNTGKKRVSGEEIDADEDIDPKFYEAVEIAVEMGKISTSLLQRRLSLGYGRAAKLIDRMEQMGVVGPQEGQKPRNILITRQDFQEMMLHRPDGT